MLELSALNAIDFTLDRSFPSDGVSFSSRSAGDASRREALSLAVPATAIGFGTR